MIDSNYTAPEPDVMAVTPQETRCVGHIRGAGYSHYGLAKNCPHAECKALSDASYTTEEKG